MGKSVRINVIGKSNKKRSYKKRALSKKEKVEVTKIAKKVFRSNVETKYIIQSPSELVMKYHNIYAINPMGLITLGTDSSSRIGEVINNVRLRVKMSYVHLGVKVPGVGANTRLWPKSQVRIMVIRTKRQLTNAYVTWPNIVNDIGRTDTALTRDNSIFYQPNGWDYPYHSVQQDVRKDNDFKVIYDKVHSSVHDHGYTDATTGGFIPNGKHTNIKFSTKIGKFEYEESNAAYSRKGLDNVYILAMAYTPKTAPDLDIAGDLVCHYSLSWTDA